MGLGLGFSVDGLLGVGVRVRVGVRVGVGVKGRRPARSQC